MKVSFIVQALAVNPTSLISRKSETSNNYVDELQNSREDLDFLGEQLVMFIDDTNKLKGNHHEAAEKLLQGAEELKMIHTLMLEDIKDLPLSVIQENPLEFEVSRRKM
jgi:hypothetical protein